MKRISISLALVTALLALNGQIKVATNNNVGIGENAPVSKFAVSAPGNSYSTAHIENINAINYSRGLQVTNSITTSSWGYSILGSTPFTSLSSSCNVGIRGQAYSSDALSSRRSYGVWGMAGNATSGWNYGVYGQLAGSHNGAAIFAAIPGRGDCNVGGIWAGYFRGDVYIEDDLECEYLYERSDIALKDEIRALSSENSLQIEKLKTLTAIKYKLKTPLELYQIGSEVSDTLSLDAVAAEYLTDKYTRDKIGLSAEEVQLVYPELVKQGKDGYLRMHYTGLIPVLVEAIKEQDAAIVELQSEIAKMKVELDRLRVIK
jgi:hypothetical protein